MNILSLFSGAGGMDRGFEMAGFQTIWANEYDKDIWATYEANFPHVVLNHKSICDISSDEIPDADGLIGGPPCQSWSEAGTLRGIDDSRGKLFFEFIRVLEAKQPKFFVAENVSGMLAARHAPALQHITQLLTNCGYELSVMLLNAVDFSVPQERKRLFFVGFRKDLGACFRFPDPIIQRKTLRDAISDLTDNTLPAQAQNKTNGLECIIPNHEYMIGGFSSIFMSRNRVRTWDEPSFTIQAGGRHAPIHPQAPKMHPIGKDRFSFVSGSEHLYRRLSVRECAHIQTFPPSHIFHYTHVAAGYKMVGNAVPCQLAFHVAQAIKEQLSHT
ncbi:MAG: DNA cytosine methyltransferase [Alphaproteobacteria bacterium]|nr:MAG: DNA cytosine methyltransferase [Alphaproteobacteria bacterium]TAF41715.1 MAG: DNA cytosine methyltransferase [Alphaproteobacteria bacterium]TAF75656.1 MAG: DNA cytosine methyltransferase [Alphaproteobacteria bacterium]